MTTPATTVHDLKQLTGTYVLDRAHTRIGFSARHAMVTKVHGKFTDFDGTFSIDGADPAKSNVDIEIRAASIDTGHEQRDGHLRSNDFLAMEEYPVITFKSTSVKETSDDTFDLTGDLTIRGVSKPVTVPFTFTGAVNDHSGKVRAGFEGSVSINRKDWGVNWNAPLEAGGVLVSEKVTLEFDIAATRNES
jgi:polyisoprenoid-binding protein YceI